MSGCAAAASETVPPAPLPIGTLAPDFTLRDQNNQVVTLSELRGSKVLLVFFPLAFTGMCEGELGVIRDRLPEFTVDGNRVLAISVGPSPTHKVWSSAQGFLFPILSDFWPHGDVARRYGVFNETAGYADRGTIVVDAEGRVVFAEVLSPGEARGSAVWGRALAALAS